ncbi:hypothetical protein [Vibrio phage LP.2]|nr:hypothetical protein [Vibrio phage LP.2]
MIQLEYFDYDKTTLSVSMGGDDYQIGVLSAFSVEFMRAASLFDKQVEAAKAQDIPLYDELVVGQIKTEEPNDQYKLLNSYLSKAIVCDWPFEEDIIETLKENQPLCNSIQAKAHELAKEYSKKKMS